ncbi:unnamed protein product [Kluyveromyces dobzhanskii CBS 2104]|uniref:DNA mismatch repair protein HSM3 n=1 Tax=Kluyveromyces dobzhanskii CBS 2104 TaxID=1427455 RepID=A0A0A8L8C2_9SACH|nr:unnamed protein product [Kluyveromyces dobzhanskii CBS 2104]
MTSLNNEIDLLADALRTMELSHNINDLMEKLALNLSSSDKLSADVKPLLTSIKTRIVSLDSSVLDYGLLLQVLDAVVRLCAFEDVLDVFEVDDLVTALQSGDKALTEIACQIVAAASPRDIFAGTPLLDEMLKLYFDEFTVVAVVNMLERTFDTSFTNQLNRRRILGNNLPILLNAKDCSNSTSFCRLLDLLKMLCANVTFEEFRKDLFIVDNSTIEKLLESDILVFIHICQYYIELLAIATEGVEKKWIIRYMQPGIEIFGEAFARKEGFFDVDHFAKCYLLRVFSRISYLHDKSYIQQLESKYFPLAPDKSYLSEFLTVLDPVYIAKSHLDLLTDIPLRAGNVCTFVNLLKDEECFMQMKDEVNSKNLNAMPYIEKLSLLVSLSLTSHGIRHLIQDLPSVMASILNGGNEVTEKLSFDLRLTFFENLLEASHQELSIYLAPVQSEYSNMLNGRRGRFSPEHHVANDYL